MREIESESKFIWKFILHIILTPLTLLQVLLGKKRCKDLLRPFYELFKFIFEPKFTITLIIVNIIIFIVSMIFFSEEFFSKLVSYPSDILSFRVFTLITSGFLHANFAHLFGNMLGIFIFGRVVEKKIGSVKTALIYFGALIISGVFTSLIHLTLIKVNTGGIGASGALMGLISAAMLLSPFYITYELIIPLPIIICGWILIYADIVGVINPVEDGIGHFAHIGGFLSIALLMFFFGGEDKKELRKGLLLNIVSVFIFAILYFILIK